MIPLSVVTVAFLVGAAVLYRKLRQWDQQDADERARWIIDEAERHVRIAESRIAHPSNREPEA